MTYNIESVNETEWTLKRKLDGIIFSSTNFGVIRTADHFLLGNFLLDIVYPSTFKGLDLGVTNCKSYKVSLGKFHDMTVALVISVGLDCHINFGLVSKELRDMSFEIVNGMHDTTTWAQWRAISENVEKRIINTADIELFGNRFLKRTKDYFNRICGRVMDIRLILARFGQDFEYQQGLENILGLVNFDYVNQIIVHHALDYTCPNNTLVWDRDSIRQEFDKKKISKEYFVCLLKGVGNFYLNLENFNTRENIHFVEAKFYSEVFKNQHKGTSLKFGTPNYAKNLFSPQEYAFGFCKRYKRAWQNALNTIQAVERELRDIATEKRQYAARFETIVRLDGDFYIEDVEGITQLIDNHPDLNAKNIAKCLCKVATNQLRLHLDVNLMPFVQVLKRHVQTRVDVIQSGETCINLSVLNPGDYFLCLAAEAIICFSIYGNVYWRRGKKMYPNWLIMALGITRSDYKKRDETLGWLFPIIQRQPELRFQPLNAAAGDIIKAVAEQIKIEEEYFLPLCELDSAVYELDSGLINQRQMRTVIKKVANLIVSCAIQSAFCFGHIKKPKAVQNKLKTLEEKQCTEEQKVVTTDEYVQLLFTTNEYMKEYLYLAWVRSCITYILKGRPIEMRCLQQYMRNYLEELLLNQGRIFRMGIIHLQYKFLTVVPSSGTVNVSFNKIRDQSTRENIVANYYSLLQEQVAHNVINQTLCRNDLPIDATFGFLKTVFENANRLY